MDMFYGQDITDMLLSFSNEDPFSDQWDRYQVGSMNFLLNTGSILIPILSVLALFNATVRTIHYFAKKNHKYRPCRKIGSKLYPQLYILPAIVTLFLEGSLDLIIATCLQIQMMILNQDDSTTPSDYIQEMICIICASVLLGKMLMYIKLYLTFRNSKALRYATIKESENSILYEGLKATTFGSIYNLGLLLQRIVTCSVLVFCSVSILQC